MPNYFRFMAPDAEEPTQLMQVERELLDDLGIPEDQIREKYWHPAFEILQLAASVGAGESEEKFDRMLGHLDDGTEEGARRKAIYRSYLLGPKYRTDAWYMAR